jgi:hypothetical protein
MVEIICKWRTKDKFLINPDGQVFPCCYLGNTEYFTNVTNGGEGIKYPFGPKSYIMQKYDDVRDELNAFKHPLEEVLEHPWWNELESSWSDDEKVERRCVRYCSKGDKTPR